jgi:hypothetical protein
MFHRTNNARHGRVIDQEGNSLEETRPLARLLFAAGFSRHDPEPPAMHLPYATNPADLQGVARMPFATPTLGMRRPTPPRQPLTIRQLVQDGFSAAGHQLDDLVKVMSSGWRKLAAENDARLTALDDRLAALGARVHAWAAAEDGRQLAEAYATGGTEQLMKLTPAVLAEMDRRAKTVSA